MHGVYTDGSATAFGNVEEIIVQGPPAGRIPESEPLTLSLDGNGDLTLEWGASCLAGDTDYEVYEGTIGDFSSHAPLLCTTGGSLSATVTPGAGDRYYLIVPSNGFREGSYGLDSAGIERPVGSASCMARTIGACQ